MIFDLCEPVEADIERPIVRSHSLPVSLQVLVALRFFASGSFQISNGDMHNISKVSVCRIVRDVSNSLCTKGQRYVKFPCRNTDRHVVMQGFAYIANFPNVVGAIHCTHIPIKGYSF